MISLLRVRVLFSLCACSFSSLALSLTRAHTTPRPSFTRSLPPTLAHWFPYRLVLAIERTSSDPGAAEAEVEEAAEEGEEGAEAEGEGAEAGLPLIAQHH